MTNVKFRLERMKYPIFWLSLLIVFSILIKSIVTGDLGQLGLDSDDSLRLAQIKDFLAGQSWFHTDQYRMGLAGGTDMHWSRIPDIPVILLTWFFDIFMPQDQALKWAYSGWPLMTAGLFIYAISKAAKFWEGRKTLVFTLALAAFFAFNFFRFTPGSIDHHNIQIALVALAMAFALDAQARSKSYLISGLAVALVVAIGVEVYLFAAVISGFVALNWAVKGDEKQAGTQAYGLGLAAGLILAFIGTIVPSDYARIYCDSLSLITVSAGATGALGLAFAARIFAGRPALWRWGALGIIGIACVTLLAFQAPQCLANPLDTLPDDVVNLWLNDIQEAKPLLNPENKWLTDIAFMIGAPLVGLAVLLFDLFRRPAWGPRYLVLGLLLTAIALTFYQVRFYPFAYIFALVPLANWAGNVFAAGREKTGGGIAYLGCVALSLPIIWAAPGILITGDSDSVVKTERAEKAKQCFGMDVITQLNRLPAGTIAANGNGAGAVLLNTKHRILSGNYHRNWQGILAQINIATSSPDESLAVLIKEDVDYLFYCSWDTETGSFVKAYPDSLFAAISRNESPDYLQYITDDNDSKDIKIFRVVR